MVYAFGLNVKGLFPGMHFAERVQLLSWLLQFPNKGPCMLLAHACLWPLPGLCPRGQRLRTPAMPAQLPLWKRDGMLGMLSKAYTKASGFLPGQPVVCRSNPVSKLSP